MTVPNSWHESFDHVGSLSLQMINLALGGMQMGGELVVDTQAAQAGERLARYPGILNYFFIAPQFLPQLAPLKAVGVNYGLTVDDHDEHRLYVETVAVDADRLKKQLNVPQLAVHGKGTIRMDGVEIAKLSTKRGTEATGNKQRTVIYTRRGLTNMDDNQILAWCSFIDWLFRTECFVADQAHAEAWEAREPLAIMVQRQQAIACADFAMVLEISAAAATLYDRQQHVS